MKYVLLLLFIASTFEMISQDTLNINEHRKEWAKAVTLQDLVWHTFVLKGTYKSEGMDGIYIGAFNVPRGSVRVAAGSRQLQEGIDFTVNYQAGTVQVLDPSVAAFDMPIKIAVENNVSR